MTISTINKLKQVIDNQKIDLLAIKLVDIFEIKDLKINFTNKKLDQVINKTNNT